MPHWKKKNAPSPIVFLFNKRKMLLIQQRSRNKQLWPRYWDCTVATHVYPNETYEGAAQRALKQEIDISATVKRLLAFVYFAPFDNHAENKYCVLLVGEYEAKLVQTLKKWRTSIIWLF